MAIYSGEYIYIHIYIYIYINIYFKVKDKPEKIINQAEFLEYTLDVVWFKTLKG